jgi:hypothetical protein
VWSERQKEDSARLGDSARPGLPVDTNRNFTRGQRLASKPPSYTSTPVMWPVVAAEPLPLPLLLVPQPVSLLAV